MENTEMPGYTQISQEEALRIMEEESGFLIVDVRRHDEYDAGHIPGAVINGIKELAGIGDEVHLMSRVVLEPILRTKQDYLGEHSQVLKLEEVLIALSICAATNPTAELALSKLQYLRGCEAHSSCILTDQDASLLRRLGINCTSEPVFENNMLFAD